MNVLHELYNVQASNYSMAEVETNDTTDAVNAG